MRALRIFSLVSLLVLGGVGSAMAQRITAPGSYEVNVCIAPGFLPGGPGSLPVELQGVDEQVYGGTLQVKQNANGTYSLDFVGERADGATLRASAEFESDWGGFLLGVLTISGAGSVSDCVTGIDVANLISARINGIGSFDGSNQRLLAKIGAGGTFDSYSLKKAPGPFRR